MPNYATGEGAKEIILAGGNLEYSTTITGEISGGTWSGVGFTDKDTGGTLTDKQATFRDIKVTGLDDPVKRKPLDREVMMKVKILQTNLVNFAVAMGGNPSEVVDGVYKGGKSVEAQQLKWRYTIPNEDETTKDKRIYIPLGRIVEASEVKFADDTEAGIEVTIKAEAVRGSESPAIEHLGAALTGYRYVILEGSFV